MKIGITGRLFLVILATNVLIAVAVGVAERVSFDRGFRDYMREREGERLDAIAKAVANEWREKGSFESLRGNNAAWERYVQAAFERAHGMPPPGADLDPLPPPRPMEPMPGPPPARGPPPPDAPTLFDRGKRVVIGGITEDMRPVLRPVTVDGTTVGWVAGMPLRAPFTGAERRLAEQQWSASLVIAGIAVLLAAVAGYFLARGFIAPVRQLAVATHRLAAGDYATRVASSRTDEIGQLTADFNRLATTLDSTERLRRQFMADVSHELRTPLAILRGELEAIEDGIRTLTPERLRSLQAEVATLGKLVDDLYDLSLTDVGAMKLHQERIDLRDVVEAAARAFEDRLASRDLALECVLPRDAVHVEADARRLTQVLNNLFENSARYTDPGGRVQVRVTADGPHASIDVTDSAPGVPGDALPHLFDRFYRVDASRNRRSGGAGLGLALARGLVEAQGGKIVARPSPLGGLWIRVTLPIAR